MTKIATHYIGDLRTECVHLQSGTTLLTDAPLDNQGKGEYFSPTDLLATSLVSCMLTTLAIRCREASIDIEGVKAEAEKIMSSNPRKVKTVVITITMPTHEYSSRDKKVIEAAINNCPVALSILPDIAETTIKYST